jgi:lysophospholipase L1-like esterase
MKKKILVYGDSNVWGFNNGKRLPDNDQWVNILKNKLGEQYAIIQEGLNNRVAGDCEKRNYLNGKNMFEAIYRSASPIEIVIVAVGENDLKPRYDQTPETIVNNILWYKKKVTEICTELGCDTKFYCLAIPNFAPREGGMQDEMRQEVNKLLSLKNDTTIFLDEIDLDDDGVHFSKKGHRQVAELVGKYLLK